MAKVNIIGAGLAGLSAAITLAEQGYECNLISNFPSERAQSVLAEGGINAALDTCGEQDTVENHFEDTMRGGVYLADPNAVWGLVQNAPQVVQRLADMGVPFNMENGRILLRSFGGQKKKRREKHKTGKMLVNALIDEARKYEARGLITRFCHHEFIRLLLEEERGVRVKDTYTGRQYDFVGNVILATGGINGVFPGMTTGTVHNTGDVTATVFAQGMRLSNLEMMQYHPTTIGISGKRMLVTEAARGEGGRLFVNREGSPWYFMEEKYPELKNLMPRDVVAREMYFVVRREDTDGQVYLDMRGLPGDVWKRKLSDLREELLHYLALDPAKEPIPVEPGIHYFCGGIDVDERHATNLAGVYAAGECCSQYHGANRLGGNSLLGAVYGGKVAAQSVMADGDMKPQDGSVRAVDVSDAFAGEASPALIEELGKHLYEGLGIVRSEADLSKALGLVCELEDTCNCQRETARIALAKAILKSALARRESRGAHYREDYPDRDETFQRITVADAGEGKICISWKDIPERRGV